MALVGLGLEEDWSLLHGWRLLIKDVLLTFLGGGGWGSLGWELLGEQLHTPIARGSWRCTFGKVPHLQLFVPQLVCIIVTTEDAVAAFKDYVPKPEDDEAVGSKAAAPAPPPAAAPSSPPPAPTPVAAASAPSAPAPAGARVFATPYAKTLAAEKGIDLKVCMVYVVVFCCCEKGIDLRLCLMYVVPRPKRTSDLKRVCMVYVIVFVVVKRASIWGCV